MLIDRFEAEVKTWEHMDLPQVRPRVLYVQTASGGLESKLQPRVGDEKIKYVTGLEELAHPMTA